MDDYFGKLTFGTTSVWVVIDNEEKAVGSPLKVVSQNWSKFYIGTLLNACRNWLPSIGMTTFSFVVGEGGDFEESKQVDK